MGKVIPMRPKCDVPGCKKRAQNTSTSMNPRWRKASWVCEEFGYELNGYVCHKHHCKNYAMGDWKYKVYRKKYCENRDGRLGFVCTYVPPPDELLEHLGLEAYEAYLQVDHKDGNHLNNNPKNLQTLCDNCHRIKTYLNKDWATAGRKSR